jgi:hypothetical protein
MFNAGTFFGGLGSPATARRALERGRPVAFIEPWLRRDAKWPETGMPTPALVVPGALPPWLLARRGVSGLGASAISAILAAAGTAKTTAGAKDIPTPMDLYNEAAPRIVKGLKQYDAAAPLIDFATQNWWLVGAVWFILGVGASYAGNLLYHKLHKKA